jgi:hypothetical protein
MCSVCDEPTDRCEEDSMWSKDGEPLCVDCNRKTNWRIAMNNLKKHDGVSETFVCRDCMVEIDPVGGNYPDWTKEQCDSGECPHCGGTDTAWLFADNCESCGQLRKELAKLQAQLDVAAAAAVVEDGYLKHMLDNTEARQREVQRWSWNCSPNECAQRAYDLGWTRLEIRDAMEAVTFNKCDIDKVLHAFWELKGENWDD